MKITRNSLATDRGSSERFTGEVYVDRITAPAGGWRIGATWVRFTPGARTGWHAHAQGQTIWVTEGVGLCQRRGGPIELIRPGDSVLFEPGEDHWHGAAATRFMTHVALSQTDEGDVTTFGDPVSDEEYAKAPAIGT